MRRVFGIALLSTVVLSFVLVFPLVTSAQGRRSRVLVVDRVDENRLQRLGGNTRSEANAQNDLGPVADDFAMDHMLLQLQRPPEQEQAIQQLIDQLHDPQSPNFHKWLTRGPDRSDVWTRAGGHRPRSPAGFEAHGFDGQSGVLQAGC